MLIIDMKEKAAERKALTILDQMQRDIYNYENSYTIKVFKQNL